MPNSSNTTHCVLCETKLVKNGKTAAGNQRWKCPRCGASSSRTRQDVTHRAELDRFLSWLLGKHSQAEITGTRTGRSFRRNTAWCWQIRPALPPVTAAPELVIIDGTYLADYGLLIAVNEQQVPLAWQWCGVESEAAWTALLRQIPAPKIVVCDGGSGVHAAIRTVWPKARVQRCIFHIWMNQRKHLTLNPRTPAGQALLGIGKRLRRIDTIDAATEWLLLVNDWWSAYGHLTKERSYAKQRADGSWDSPTGKRWWYTHDRLRKAYNQLADLIRKGHLFVYLETGCPKTTSRLEGGINAAIKQTLRLHRGMTPEHQQRAAEWVLIDKAGLLANAHTYTTAHPVAHPPKQRPRFTEPDPGPALYDTGLDASEGLWLRHGWAGRG